MKTKNIIKEIIIVLLLILAIILILGILLYEYVPNNKIIPQQVSYTTPENVKEELSTSENVDDSQVIMTYEVTATNYKKTKDYVSGKKNPFESIESQNNTTENATSGNTVNSGTTGNSSTTNTTTDNTQQGYLPDKGTK